MQQVTVDINDRLEEIEDTISTLETIANRLETVHQELEAGEIEVDQPSAVLNRVYDGVDGGPEVDVEEFDEDVEPVDVLEEDYRLSKDSLATLEKTKRRVSEKIDEWGGSEFIIEEFTMGRQAQRNDLARSDMLQDRDTDPRANVSANKLRTIQVGVVQTPPDAPSHPKQYPPSIGQYLYDCIENLNSYGTIEAPDFSLSRSRSGSGSE